jgi:RNA polymerase primary sigma factor
MNYSNFLTEEQSLRLYLKEIGKYDTLPVEDEARLAQQIHRGDRRALAQLVRANLRFVVSVARKYQNQGIALSDLISVGNLGLMEAARRYDETKNFKFISYAVWWIRQAILHALAEQSRIVNLPLNRVGIIYKVSKAQRKLEQKFLRLPTIEEVATELNLTPREVQETIQIGNSAISLDSPVRADDDSAMIDILCDETQEMPDGNMLRISLQKEIEQILQVLTPREQKIIKLYFGIECYQPHTLEEIGQRFSLTRERVRQIKEKAIARLKYSSKQKHVRRPL